MRTWLRSSGCTSFIAGKTESRYYQRIINKRSIFVDNTRNCAEWYSSAAKQKDAEALCSLAHMYRDGRGCIKDSAKAFKCYSDSARYGDVPAAMTNLARCYEKGIGVPPDAAMAGYWREEAIRAAYANDKR